MRKKYFGGPGELGFKSWDWLLAEKGQSTVEFAVVLAGFLSMVLALGALWNIFSDASVVSHAVQGASHAITGVYSQVVCDVFLY